MASWPAPNQNDEKWMQVLYVWHARVGRAVYKSCSCEVAYWAAGIRGKSQARGSTHGGHFLPLRQLPLSVSHDFEPHRLDQPGGAVFELYNEGGLDGTDGQTRHELDVLPRDNLRLEVFVFQWVPASRGLEALACWLQVEVQSFDKVSLRAAWELPVGGLHAARYHKPAQCHERRDEDRQSQQLLQSTRPSWKQQRDTNRLRSCWIILRIVRGHHWLRREVFWLIF